MQVIEALRTSILVPHDHLHIKQMRTSLGAAGSRSRFLERPGLRDP